MSKYILSFTMFIMFILVGCKKDEPTKPPESVEPTNLIANGSFELNRQPSLEGWNMIWPPGDTAALHNLSFSKDVPPDGGVWSLKIIQTEHLELVTEIDLPKVDHIFKLSLWAKTTASYFTEARLMVTGKGWCCSSGKSISISDTLWKEYSITSENMDSSYQRILDSIRVFQVVLSIDRNPFQSGNTYFDLIKLEKLN